MQNLLKVKLDYEDKLRMIPGTHFKTEQGWLKVYDGENWSRNSPKNTSKSGLAG